MKPFLLAAALLSLASTALARDPTAAPLVNRFMRAWSASDAAALGALFENDADFISPSGILAEGRPSIQAFYAAAFARGYAGSVGAGEVVRERRLSADLLLVDARFSISGARAADGSARPSEKGILAAVLRREGAGWKIEALRESEGAAGLVPFSASPK